MTISKRSKKKKPVPMDIEFKVPENFDPVYWERQVYYKDTRTGDRFSAVQWVARKASGKVIAEYSRVVCRHCDELVVDGKFTCYCVVHKNCQLFQARGTPVLGACLKQEHCKSCCSCIVCVKCKKFQVVRKRFLPIFKQNERQIPAGYCMQCKQCKDCCTCKVCVNCGKKTQQLCCSPSTRPHHIDCCDSDNTIHEHSGLLWLKRPPMFHTGNNFQHNRCRRFISIESEVAKFRTKDLHLVNEYAKKWSSAVVTEGTVPEGGEICTAPSNGDAFLRQIHELLAAYGVVGAQVNVRCGMHVHLDARDFMYSDLVNLLYLYDKIEVGLFAMLPPWRRLSRFAVPCRDDLMKIAKGGNNLVESIRDIEIAHNPSTGYKGKDDLVKKKSIALKMASNLYGQNSLGNVKRFHKTMDNQRIRYMSLNLHSWIYRRTIEFRHFQGTLDEQEMVMWPQVLGAIMDTAKRMPITGKRGQPCISHLSNNPVEALLEVVQPKSWINGTVQQFVKDQLKKWSPDFNTIWPLFENEKNAVHPLHVQTKEGLGLGFDINKKLYTYLPQSAMTWDHQWGEPTIVRGRYATTNDLVSVPKSSNISWLTKAAEPGAKAPPAAIKDEGLNLGDFLLNYNTITQTIRRA